MAEKSYQEIIGEMRAERKAKETAERIDEIEKEYVDLVKSRDECDDPQDWSYFDAEAERLENEFDKLNPPQPPAPEYTDVEADFIRQFSPQQHHESNWILRSKYNPNSLSNSEAVQSGARFAQARYIQERSACGLQTSPEDLATFRSSPAYREALEVFAPPEANGLPTPDAIVEAIKKTSRYADKDFEKKYNQEVRRMDKLGKRGEYGR